MSLSTREFLKQLRAEAANNFIDDAWYLVAACALAAVGRGDTFGDLYNVIVESGDGGDESRVSKRLREVLIKIWTLIGLPRTMSACYTLLGADAKVIDTTSRYESLLHNPEQLMKNGKTWLAKASGGDEDKVYASLNGQKSMTWVLGLAYGLFLSDLTEFSSLENESIILSSTMCISPQPLAVTNHMKSARRLGMSTAQLVVLQNICRSICEWAGEDTRKWPLAAEVDKYFDQE